MICQTNIRQVALATLIYAGDYRGQFPPALGGPGVFDPENGKNGMGWYDVNRIGKYLPEGEFRNVTFDNDKSPTVGGGVMACPNHPDGDRSYTMNHWAASVAEVTNYMHEPTGLPRFLRPGTHQGSDTYQKGQGFKDDTGFAGQLILFGEAWGTWRSETQNDYGETRWFSLLTIGGRQLPAERFGGGDGIRDSFYRHPFNGNWTSQNLLGGISPELGGTTAVMPKSDIPYYRHPRRNSNTVGVDGTANFAFVDGHVGNFAPRDLFEEKDEQVRSTMTVLWSLIDRRVERAAGIGVD